MESCSENDTLSRSATDWLEHIPFDERGLHEVDSVAILDPS